ncbi:MAG: L-2-amino-thiazoline-4-carboxylic acid hydrolase [Promethearchaeota archaeon]
MIFIISVIVILIGYKRLLLLLFLIILIITLIFQLILYVFSIGNKDSIDYLILSLDFFVLISIFVLSSTFILIILRKIDFIKFGDKPPLPKHVMNLRITLAAAKVLINRLGLKETFNLVKELKKEKKKGEPWKGILEPKDNKDRESRELIGDAIILYRLLKKDYGNEKAREIISDVIFNSSIAQLYSLIPIMKKEDIEAKSTEEREKLFTEIVNKFPNADWELIESSERKFSYKITRCRLYELVNELGYPELSDVFCKGDEVYFQRFQKDINLNRPKTIGGGDDCCEFIFSLK